MRTIIILYWMMLCVMFVLFLCGILRASEDAIAEVNNQRARAGLFPFIRDEGLTIGAERAADYCAARNIQFHTGNDGQFLPAECQRSWTSGAGMSSNKFMACYTEYPRMMPGESRHGGISGVQGQTIYAGAAIAYTSQGQRHCHLFVSGRPSSILSARPLVNFTQRIVYAAAKVTNRIVRPAVVPQINEIADVQQHGRRRMFFHRK